MADDDPYNFTIDIPNSKANAYKTSSKAAESDEESEEDYDSESPPKRTSSTKASTKAAPAPKSNALDKAKNFLSKYSKPTAKPERRRVSLEDSDDEDDSMDEKLLSGKTKKIDSSSFRNTKASKITLNDISMDEDDSRDDTTETKQPPQRATTATSKSFIDDVSMEDESTDEIKAIKHPSTLLSSQKPKVTLDDISMEDDSEEEIKPSNKASSMQTFDQSESNEEPPPPFDASASKLNQVLSVPQPIPQDDSDAYEDDIEELEEESIAEDDDKPLPTPSQTVSAAPPNEPTYDYSMEFSQDEDIPPTPQPKVTEEQKPKVVIITENEPSEHEDDYGDESFAISEPPTPATKDKEHSYESESFTNEHSIDPVPVAQEPMPEDTSTQSFTADEIPPPVAPQAEPTQNILQTVQATSILPPTPVPTQQTSRTSTNNALTPPPSTRPRITIIREYELPDRTKAEMKDASTQYTGNHVEIQANLGPYGEIISVNQEKLNHDVMEPKANEVRTSDCLQQEIPQFKPAPTAIPPMFNVSLTGNSVYRHQLQQIKLQIRRKRLEMDRMLHETTAYKYSSFDDTDKYVSLNKPRKMELWEALMLVDPSMTQEKAKKIEAMSKSA